MKYFKTNTDWKTLVRNTKLMKGLGKFLKDLLEIDMTILLKKKLSVD